MVWLSSKELDQVLKPVIDKHALLQESILKASLNVSSKIEELNSQYSELKKTSINYLRTWIAQIGPL